MTDSFSSDPGSWTEDDPGSQYILEEADYPRTNSGPLCNAEGSGYLDSADVFCPFGPDGECTSMPKCPTNRERQCLLGD
jgi:hypothetical protein